MTRRVFPFSILLVAIVAVPAAAQETFHYPEARHGKGELKYIHGLPVLMLEGTPAEIGEQEGVLAVKAAAPLLAGKDAMIRSYHLETVYPALLRLAGLLAWQLPKDHLTEIEAMARASGQPRDFLLFANAFPDLLQIGGCATLVVESSRSKTGAPLFGRNLDWPPFQDLQKYTLVSVYRPKGKHAFVSVTFPTLAGCFSAMNDAGLTLAMLEVRSAKDGATHFNPAGTPCMLLMRRVMEECATVEEAEKLFRAAPRAIMQNLAICDKKRAAVFEVTPKNLVVRPSDRGLSLCTNHFCTPELATNTHCRRFDILEQNEKVAKLGIADVAHQLHLVNQGKMTLQTMIFEPATLRLHLSFGRGPASALPMHELDLGPLFRRMKEEG